MESVSILKIMHDVRVILDQNAESFAIAGVGEYTLELNDIIYKNIVPAVLWAHMNAPVNKLVGESFTNASRLDDNVYILPFDFMRLVSLRLTTWNRSVYSCYSEDDAEVSQMLSDYSGLKPTANKPAAVLLNNDGPALAVYPWTDNASLSIANYIPYPEIEEDSDSSSTSTPYEGESIGIEPLVYDAFLYYLAHLVKMSQNEDSKFAEQAQALL